MVADEKTRAADPRFAGIERLYGSKALERLQAAMVSVIGLGGVGSWTVEALARSGVENLRLVDLDDVCVTNINRQIHAVADTVGQSKAKVLQERVATINPHARTEVIEDFFTESSAASILDRPTDVVIDAIDSFKHKCLLVHEARARGVAVVVVGGAGGRIDPSRIRLDDIAESHGDRLLSMMRKRLRQRFEFPRTGRWGVPCVYSDEPQRFPDGQGGIHCERPEGESMRLDCRNGFGAATFVTGTFGFFAAKAAIDLILGRMSTPTGLQG